MSWEYEEETSRRGKTTRKVILWEVGQTQKAYKYSTLPPGDKKAKEIWIPRSIIHHISRDQAPDSMVPCCTVEVEEWFLDKNKL